MAKPVGRLMKLPGLKAGDGTQEQMLATAMLNKGMVSDIDATVIDPEALSYAKNARIRFDKTLRRSGYIPLTPSAPSVHPVKKLLQVVYEPTRSYLIRITNTDSAYSLNGDAWVAIAAGGLSSSKFISAAIVSGNVIIADGEDPLQIIDLTAATMSDLSTTSIRAKYVTGFAERVIGANTGDSAEQQSNIAWSGTRNITIFDGAVDPTAGAQPLIYSSAVSVDPITGVFGLSSVMIIMRKESIWAATKQPIARNPFNFFPTVGNIGCDCPGSIQLANAGVYFYSQKNHSAFFYTPGMEEPVNISEGKVTKLLSVVDPDKIVSGYNNSDEIGGEYYLGFIQADGTLKLWVYNEGTKGWAFDEYANATCTAVIDQLSAYTEFEDLTGVFSALSGSFEDLSVTPTATSRLMIGYSNGDILVEDPTDDDDNEVAYETIIQSKEFSIPKVDQLFTRIRVDYEAVVNGSIIIEYSKNGGQTWTTAKTVSTDATDTNTQFIKFSKGIKSRTLMWRIRTSTGLTNFLRHEIYVTPSGESQS